MEEGEGRIVHARMERRAGFTDCPYDETRTSNTMVALEMKFLEDKGQTRVVFNMSTDIVGHLLASSSHLL